MEGGSLRENSEGQYIRESTLRAGVGGRERETETCGNNLERQPICRTTNLCSVRDSGRIDDTSSQGENIPPVSFTYLTVGKSTSLGCSWSLRELLTHPTEMEHLTQARDFIFLTRRK